MPKGWGHFSLQVGALSCGGGSNGSQAAELVSAERAFAEQRREKVISSPPTVSGQFSWRSSKLAHPVGHPRPCCGHDRDCELAECQDG